MAYRKPSYANALKEIANRLTDFDLIYSRLLCRGTLPVTTLQNLQSNQELISTLCSHGRCDDDEMAFIRALLHGLCRDDLLGLLPDPVRVKVEPIYTDITPRSPRQETHEVISNVSYDREYETWPKGIRRKKIMPKDSIAEVFQLPDIISKSAPPHENRKYRHQKENNDEYWYLPDIDRYNKGSPRSNHANGYGLAPSSKNYFDTKRGKYRTRCPYALHDKDQN